LEIFDEFLMDLFENLPINGIWLIELYGRGRMNEEEDGKSIQTPNAKQFGHGFYP
jgi:hypothetical protein